MKILVVADEASASLWDYYRPGMLKDYQLILSCGDLRADYLSFLVTMARCPLYYIHGNHDSRFETAPPEGCDCMEDMLVVYRGLRILGLGGSHAYSRGKHQYSQEQMSRRVRRLERAIRLVGGVDIVLAHSAPLGVGDQEDIPHRGFEAFLELIEKYHPQYFLHGHIHLNYGRKIQREKIHEGTKVINCCGKYDLDVVPGGRELKLTGLKKLYASMFVKNLTVIR